MKGLRLFGLLSLYLVVPEVHAKDTWIEVRSEHFSILTDASKGSAENILEDLEQLRRLVTQMLASQPVDSPTPTGIFAFRNEKSMKSFQPVREGKVEDWAALFRPTAFRNFIAFRADGSREWVRELAFQQYLYLLLSYGKVSYPLWLRSGFSLFYGNANISKKYAEVGKMHERHRRELGEYRALPLQDLFAVSYDSPHYRDETRRALFDAQAWALVHYLLIGRHPEGGQAIGQFIGLMAQGQDQSLAFQQALKMPIDEVEREVSTYIRKRISLYMKVDLPPLDSAQDFGFSELPPEVVEARLGALLVAVGRPDDARARLSAAVEANPDLPDAYEGLGFLATVEQDSKSALTFLEKAVAKGATNPQVHYRYARVLLDLYTGAVSEIPEPVRAGALAALQKALDADSSNADAARLYGFLRLFDGSSQDGVVVVKKALETSPEHVGLLFILGQLYGRQENFSAARAVYEHLLARKLDPEMVADVRRQLDWVVARMSNP